MGYSAKILLDSISESGKRLTTFEVTFPRIVLAEFNTHRMFSRNSASSRAIPFKRQLERVLSDPFIPKRFPINCSGMQPQEYYEKGSEEYDWAVYAWLIARDKAIEQAEKLVGNIPVSYEDSGNDFVTDKPSFINVHKQIGNRLLEPFMWHTVIVTATEWNNFFALRCNENAQAEIRTIADLMYDAYHYYDDKDEDDMSWGAGTDPDLPPPQNLKVGEWHCPLVSKEDLPQVREYFNKLNGTENATSLLELFKKISVARCARVSYLTHDGKRDIEKDLELFERLRTSGHWSPFEHVATPYIQETGWTWSVGRGITKAFANMRSGNFVGWKQYRKEFNNENITDFKK